MSTDICLISTDDINGFAIIYQNGHNTTQCNTTTTTASLFQCDPKAMWNPFNPNITKFVDDFTPDLFNECLVN